MNKFLHKLFYYRKKIGLTLVCLVMMGWFVYARNFDDSFTDQVKIVKFYPNPASSFINFEFPNELGKDYVLQIYSFAGKKMAEIPVSANKITVTLTNDYYRGLYVFRLTDRSGKLIEVNKFQVVK
jgi:hypothetical protein